ncbi:hypothetical protein TARUN_8693 [Trichoderma arundinaceum]|uniref:WW domain-containing protein n=1 Tax=Trichoderma arundinaceum TaxID=490622 RepID=A0A395NC99_TRIAR|nr:hypothetical protein TARUN_8693 [Trichoderma arundinaceum]
MSSPSAAAAASHEQKAESPAAVADSVQETTKDERAEDDAASEDGELTREAESDAEKDGESADGSPEESSSPDAAEEDGEVPPLPTEAVPNGPPLPDEPVPQKPEDDGWDCQWDPNSQAWFFYNRFTGKTQWENPRVPEAAGAAPSGTSAAAASQSGGPQPPSDEKPAAGGYNPAIHGDYDPNAWYAKNDEEDESASAALAGDPAAIYGATASFNRFTGNFQSGDAGPERHSDESKARRQMNAYFDVDAAANAHGGRSLKAERSNKKPTKNELKAFKEKRRARKEEKRRAWLRD